ncbi:MAG: UDP-3-O-(3-hydroxymyristoyl)glucosamine N-acyltransferase [Phycisphaerales bacterium]|nr:UDP-3-O-(3-hydroxymyristoyl)glucosamine N-acyltransferase [Phycisphaerales bacterium]
MTFSITAGDLARRVGAALRGDASIVLRGMADVAEAGPDELTFVSRASYARKLASSRAGAVLVPRDFGATPMTALRCDRVDRAVARVLALFAPPRWQPAVGVHPMASIDRDARMGNGARVGPFVAVGPGATLGAGCELHAGAFIGAGAHLGEHCVIGPNAVVADRCVLGSRVVLKAGAVVGGDGFGFYFDEGSHHRVPHAGIVIIEDDVEIGSCSCVDRAKFGATRIGAGVKIDNHVQIGHNVRVGRHGLLVAQVGISGSTRIGEYCVLAGRSGTVDGAEIADRSTLAALSVVAKSTTEGQTVMGFPAQESGVELREQAAVRRLPELIEEVRRLRARLERLEASTNDQARG